MKKIFLIICVVIGSIIFANADPPATTTCGTNEVYNECPGYCTFENDCFMYTGIVRDCAAPPPDYQCSSRCDCAPDFVRIGADCVSPSLCPNSTCSRINEIFTTCGSCDGTCANPHPICTAACTIGCFCREGYVRDVSGDCIIPDDCPLSSKCSGSNEVYNTCGSCDVTCDNPNPICLTVCTPGCFCIEGHTRDNNRACIPLNHCPKVCTEENEEFTTCGGCDPTCESPDLKCRVKCLNGCFCKKGFVRDNKKCIDPSQCF